jgi:hypothetical protein
MGVAGRRGARTHSTQGDGGRMESAQRSIGIGASAPGADDGRRHGVSPVPLSAARRAAVGAPVLHANWRLERSDLY